MEDHGKQLDYVILPMTEMRGGRRGGMTEPITNENYDPTAPLPQADPFAGRDRQLYAVDPTGRNTRNGTVQTVNQYPTTLREDLEELQEAIQRVLARL